MSADVALLSPEHRRHYDVIMRMINAQLRDLPQPVYDTAVLSAAWQRAWISDPALAEQHRADSLVFDTALMQVFFAQRPWWPGIPWLFRPLFTKAASVAHGTAKDTSAVSPAGYTKRLTVSAEDKLIVVYRWSDSLLVRAIRIPPGEGVDRFVDHAHLDQQLCADVIPR